ncbi:zeta toxin family protein [Acinetobacter baumannii]|nr:zeta toxin family protein [Acinetobacter baumannii]EKV7788426.1 zeta toxin family protein [Acinetobacter baumannii]EKW1712959.1 zeta toxin family protein [Acinetobacter baumannii]ELA7085930.1 zeta toxin family protein [Acinetobacter baumannii]ELA8819539.1 zeta toxin family protein [Acinetobacter baumannii]
MNDSISLPHKLDQVSHEELLEIIKSLFLSTSTSQHAPEAYITGGQPGSGKGKLASDGVKYFENRGGSVLIDADLLRVYHPEYHQLMVKDDKSAAYHTHEDASLWSKQLFTAAIAEKKNIVLDQVSSDSETLKLKIQELRNNGYKLVQWHVMAVSPKISRQRIYLRYETEKAQNNGCGRFVPESIHSVYKNIPTSVQNIEKENVVNQIIIYNQDYLPIFSLQTYKICGGLSGEQITTKEQAKKMNYEELQAHDNRWLSVIDQMNQRNATLTEISEIEMLRQEDRITFSISSSLISESEKQS